jgi:copper resistance protein D
MEIQSAQQLATVALNLGTALAVGCCLSAAWMAGAGSPWALRCRPQLLRCALAALAVAGVADLAILWLQAAAMAEVPVLQARSAVAATLTGTHFGNAWMAGFAALAVAAAAAALRQRAAAIVALVALALFLYSRSMLSHAAADGDASLRLAIDWLHLVLVSVWVGEVFVAGLFTLHGTAGGPPTQRAEQARYIEALSTSATVALGGIVLSGLYNTWHGLGSVSNAFGNPYATALLVKLLLVGFAALLGGVNRMIVMPALLGALRRNGTAAERTGRRFTVVLQVEAALLAAALVAAAVLSSTAPPGAA